MSSNLHFVAKCTFSQKKCTILFSLCKFVFCWPFVDAKITQNPKIWIRAQKLTEWHRYVRKLNQDRNPFNMFFFVLFWRISVSGRVAGWGQGGPQSSFCKTQSLMFHQKFQILNFCSGQIFVLVALQSPKFGKFCFHDCPQKLTCTNIAHPMRRMSCIFSGWTLQGVKFLIWTTFDFLVLRLKTRHVSVRWISSPSLP